MNDFAPVHPARYYEYDILIAALREAHAAKLVSMRRDGRHSIWCYTPACVYGKGWNDVTTLARGLILDEEDGRVVATPFPKFWNMGERGDAVPDVPFEVFEKLDGSLIIIWNDGERWRTATKGSFDSSQATAAARILGDACPHLGEGCTYLAEYVGPANRIVVPYDREELVLLAVYGELGHEWDYSATCRAAKRIGWRTAGRHEFASLADLVAHASELPATREGFVIRFQDGTRLKVKGEQYRRIHALISRCTPLAMWEAMINGDNLPMIRDQLPDEFLGDFDLIVGLLQARVDRIFRQVHDAAAAVRDWSDKEVGLSLGNWPDPVRSLIFPYRKTGGDLMSGRSRLALLRAIRPDGNVLTGYLPSYAMHRIAEESV